MTRITHDPAPLPAEGRLVSYELFNMQEAHIHSGSSVELGFGRGTLRSRDLTIRPPQPSS
ncbi:hypothetical protein AVEN_131026-1, partial [Araneus ventricosus]